MRKVALGALCAVVVLGGPLLAMAGGADPEPDRQRGSAPAAFAWQGAPVAVKPEGGGDAGIVTGKLRNTSLRPAELDVSKVRVLDADGRALDSSARFLQSFAHGIYSREMIFRDGAPPSAERRRLGEIATVNPGDALPLTVSWRGAAAVVDLGGPTVPLPQR